MVARTARRMFRIIVPVRMIRTRERIVALKTRPTAIAIAIPMPMAARCVAPMIDTTDRAPLPRGTVPNVPARIPARPTTMAITAP